MLFFKQFDLLDENKKKTNNNTNFERNTFLRLNVKGITLNKNNILKQISIILIQLFYITSKEIKLSCTIIVKIKPKLNYLKS